MTELEEMAKIPGIVERLCKERGLKLRADRIVDDKFSEQAYLVMKWGGRKGMLCWQRLQEVVKSYGSFEEYCKYVFTSCLEGSKSANTCIFFTNKHHSNIFALVLMPSDIEIRVAATVKETLN